MIKLESPVYSDFNKVGENFEHVLSRISDTTQFTKDNKIYPYISTDANEILLTAITRLNLTLCRIERIKEVAKTIALMDYYYIINAWHISEAIGYQIFDGLV